MTKMNPKVKAKWVAALRSGEYKQGTGQLRYRNEFCCLGVLCNLHAKEHPRIAAKQVDSTSYMKSSFLPPSRVAEWAGLDVDAAVKIGRQEAALYHHNDAGRTFAEIADAIEEQL